MNFAKRMNFDPLDPNNWYSMSQKTITQTETVLHNRGDEEQLANIEIILENFFVVSVLQQLLHGGFDGSPS